MAKEEVDPDLQKLLSELESAETEPEELEEPVDQVKPPSKIKRPNALPAKPQAKPEVVTPPKDDPVINKSKAPQEIVITGEQVESISAKKEDTQTLQLMQEILKGFSDAQKSISKNITDDRTKIDQFIQMFTDRISDAENTKAVYVEALTALLATRATASIHSTKMLDSMAKMIAAIKNMEIGNSSGPDLAQLLQDSPGTGFDEDQP